MCDLAKNVAAKKTCYEKGASDIRRTMLLKPQVFLDWICIVHKCHGACKCMECSWVCERCVSVKSLISNDHAVEIANNALGATHPKHQSGQTTQPINIISIFLVHPKSGQLYLSPQRKEKYLTVPL